MRGIPWEGFVNISDDFVFVCVTYGTMLLENHSQVEIIKSVLLKSPSESRIQV